MADGLFTLFTVLGKGIIPNIVNHHVRKHNLKVESTTKPKYKFSKERFSQGFLTKIFFKLNVMKKKNIMVSTQNSTTLEF